MDQFLETYGMVLMWAIVAVITLSVEAATAEMVSIWFTPGALVTMVLSIWVKIFWIQLLVFLALSAILLVIARRHYKKHPLAKNQKMNADAVVGKTGVVQEPINNIDGTGSVKVGALEWTARSADDAVNIPQGTIVSVKEISGVKLICEPTSQKAGSAAPSARQGN